ncbi:MAG: type II toxin-antitoxin system RelE/ParE family toxin [Symploca sp. SIO3E6]|nr:type II toxin-antitoxin system RelE/ParE family toxin [Caldora sp. SIO3E6]
MKTLRITLPASQDLNAISDYFLEQSIDAGERFVETFNQKCKYLVRYPYMGKSYTHLKPGLRGLSLMGEPSQKVWGHSPKVRRLISKE